MAATKLQFDSERDTLADALAIATRAADRRTGGIIALAGVRLEVLDGILAVDATDTDIWAHIELPVPFGAVGGVALVAGRLLHDIVKSAPPGRVTVTVDDDEATIQAGRSTFNIRCLPTDEFPKLPAPAGDHQLVVAADTFTDACAQVAAAASRDQSRPLLTGVLIEPEGDHLRLAATDSYRLAVRDVPGVGPLADTKVIVPSKVLTELVKIVTSTKAATLGVTLTEGGRYATFTVGSTTIGGRTIEGDFPDYRRLIPSTTPHTATVERDALIDTLSRVKILAREAAPIRLAVADNQIVVTATTLDVGAGTETVEAVCATSIDMAFNPTFLIDALRSISADTVTLGFTDAIKPATIRAEPADDLLYLLMPVRV